jgi:hypothetical protein
MGICSGASFLCFKTSIIVSSKGFCQWLEESLNPKKCKGKFGSLTHIGAKERVLSMGQRMESKVSYIIQISLELGSKI